MLDTEPTTGQTDPTSTTDQSASPAPRRRRAASRPAGPPQPAAAETPTAATSTSEPAAPAATAPPAVTATEPAPAKKTARKATKKAAKRAPAEATTAIEAPSPASGADTDPAAAETAPAKKAARKTAAGRTTRTRTRKGAAAADPTADVLVDAPAAETAETGAEDEAAAEGSAPAVPRIAVLFQPPATVTPAPRRRAAKATAAAESAAEDVTAEASAGPEADAESDTDSDEGGARRRRRGGRGRRGRGRTGDDGEAAAEGDEAEPTDEPATAGEDDAEGTSSRRRRRRRRRADGEDDAEPRPDDPPNTVVRVRQRREKSGDDEVRSVKGSVRLEAKKQRRRDGRDQGRRRTTVITEAEFLARREAVHREMLVRQSGERTQIAVLEDDVLVEHHVTSASATGLVGNVYLGRVQNVLPSMEAAFVDVGKGRNAVLYAGEVNWDAAGLEGQPKRIEVALKSGDAVLVQVTKDPIGHKGARLTSQISLPGRFLVYVPGGSMTGISRKLPDTERTRLKAILKQVVPEEAGVIVRTAAEGASEEELRRDVARLKAQWEDIEKKAKTASAPALLYAEPDLAIRVVRDIFNEDFASMVVAGDDAWETIQPYVGHVAPDLADRLSRWTEETDLYTARRVDEQLLKALDRKVWLPSGGYLVIDRTEAMVVVDVNTGKFTGAGGDLEETVTRNNLEAAEEIVRQLRLRDLGGIIVIDFIDMVLESNRELVLRRLLECLGRDRTKHQVAEVTSLGLVQMTRKRVGQGLHEVFSETCECCNGRGVHVRLDGPDPREKNANGNGGGRGRDRDRDRGKAAGKAKDDGGPKDAGSDAAPAKEGRSGKGSRAGRAGKAGKAAKAATSSAEDTAPDDVPTDTVAAANGDGSDGDEPTAPRGRRGGRRGRSRSEAGEPATVSAGAGAESTV